jgi:putative transcriptional regulator
MTTAVRASDNDLYAAYAAGTLDPAYALLVETQGAIRADVGRVLAQSDVVSASIMETSASAEMSDSALDRALAAIDALEAGPAESVEAGMAAGAAMEEVLALPEPLRSAVLEAIGRRGWQVLGNGLKRLRIDAGSDLETELYRIAPGARIPRHTHAGPEYTLVVAGGFTDERGSYGPGDVCRNGPEDTHTPVADEDGVCYALAVREGGLRFKGVLGALQRLFVRH